eukprot:7386906-Prymnesium_polylepis.1
MAWRESASTPGSALESLAKLVRSTERLRKERDIEPRRVPAMALTSRIADKLTKCLAVQRMASTSRSHWMKQDARGKTRAMANSAKFPVKTGATSLGMSSGGTTGLTMATVRNLKISAAVRGVRCGLSRRSARETECLSLRSLCSTPRKVRVETNTCTTAFQPRNDSHGLLVQCCAAAATCAVRACVTVPAAQDLSNDLRGWYRVRLCHEQYLGHVACSKGGK